MMKYEFFRQIGKKKIKIAELRTSAGKRGRYLADRMIGTLAEHVFGPGNTVYVSDKENTAFKARKGTNIFIDYHVFNKVFFVAKKETARKPKRATGKSLKENARKAGRHRKR